MTAPPSIMLRSTISRATLRPTLASAVAAARSAQPFDRLPISATGDKWPTAVQAKHLMSKSEGNDPENHGQPDIKTKADPPNTNTATAAIDFHLQMAGIDLQHLHWVATGYQSRHPDLRFPDEHITFAGVCYKLIADARSAIESMYEIMKSFWGPRMVERERRIKERDIQKQWVLHDDHEDWRKAVRANMGMAEVIKEVMCRLDTESQLLVSVETVVEALKKDVAKEPNELIQPEEIIISWDISSKTRKAVKHLVKDIEAAQRVFNKAREEVGVVREWFAKEC